jgi:ATP-dependent Clp protease, protease subunit
MPKREPMRCFEGSTRPHEPFWRLVDAVQAESGEPEIEFYGYISEYSWWDDDITPAQFKQDLYGLGKSGPVTVRINSGGGDVVAASMIRAMIIDYPGRVTVRIDGLCASAATFVATAGDVVRMQDTAYFMIHDPATMAWGTVDDLKQVIDLLKTVKSGIIDAYQAKTKLDTERLAKMMADETWLTAKEAQALGFIDEVISANPGKTYKAMQNAVITNALRNYVNLPEPLQAILRPVTDDPTIDPVAERLRAEAKLYA